MVGEHAFCSWLPRPLLCLTILALAKVSFAETCSSIGGECKPGVGQEDASLLQFDRAKSLKKGQGHSQVPTRLGCRSKVPSSIYFIMVNTFERSDGNTSSCGCQIPNCWCGGDIRGVMQRLDYIQNMGFEAIWLSPVVKQFDGVDGPSGAGGSTGYWAYNIYEIDPHFGTSQDLYDLVQELHARGMVIMYDFVANHMGPIHSVEDTHKIVPFNKPEYFHQLFRGNLTFDEYTYKMSGWPPPAQAMWSQSGAQCTKGENCNCYQCVEDPASPCWQCVEDPKSKRLKVPGCNGTMQPIPGSPCPKDSLSPYCMPGDYQCQGYNETITWEGWFYDLGDLNHSHPFVNHTMLEWIKWFVQEYDLDYLRLDTAPFMPWWFLSNLQDAAGISIMGEVTTTNMTFHAEFQARDGERVLDGVLNFPLYYSAISGFCGTYWPYSTLNLTFLGERMEAQSRAPYTSLERLGNFIDNHDVPRVTKECAKDMRRVRNALAWTYVVKGIPIVYMGTENFQEGNTLDEPMWTTGFDENIPGYKLIKKLNEIRSTIAADAAQHIVCLDKESGPRRHEKLGIVRGHPHRPTVVALLNNLPDGEDSPEAEFCYDAPTPHTGFEWIDAMTGRHPKRNRKGCFLGKDPIILTLQRKDSIAEQ